MASRREQFETQGGRRACSKVALVETADKGGRKKRIAMVPARVFSGTPEFAKGVVGRWGKTISFEDDRPFFLF